MGNEPHNQGLYEARCEHNACGIGAAVNISSRGEDSIIGYGKQMLLNQHHRGLGGAEEPQTVVDADLRPLPTYAKTLFTKSFAKSPIRS